jgi:hypothetical protein
MSTAAEADNDTKKRLLYVVDAGAFDSDGIQQSGVIPLGLQHYSSGE